MQSLKAYSKLRKMYKKEWYAYMYGANNYSTAWLFYLELQTYDKPPTLQNTLP